MWYGKTEAQQDLRNSSNDRCNFNDKDFMLDAVHRKVDDDSIKRAMNKGVSLPSLEGAENPYGKVDFEKEKQLSQNNYLAHNINKAYQNDLKNVNYKFKELTKDQEKAIFEKEQKLAETRKPLPHPWFDKCDNLDELQRKYLESLKAEEKAASSNFICALTDYTVVAPSVDVSNSNNYSFEIKLSELSEQKINLNTVVTLYVSVVHCQNEDAIEKEVAKISALYAGVKSRLPKNVEFVAVPCRYGTTRLETCHLGGF